MKAYPVIGFALGVAMILALSYCHRNDHLQAAIPKAAEVPYADKLVGYDEFNEAAVYAAQKMYACSKVYECGGAIGKRDSDGKFVVGDIGTSYSGDSLEDSHTPGAPKGSKQVSGYHSHVCLPKSHYNNYFSRQDVAEATEYSLPEVMLDLCSGKVHYFDPKSMPAQDAEPGVDYHTTAGQIIGQITVSGESYEAVLQ